MNCIMRLILFLFLILVPIVSYAQIDLTRVPDDDSKADFEAFIDSAAPSEDAFVAVQRLAYRSIQEGRWDDAKSIFSQHQAKFPAMQDRFEKIIAILDAPIEDLSLMNLGTGVNSDRDEYSPTISVDGKWLYFTRNNSPDETGEDVIVSEYRDSAWQPAELLGSPVDTKSNESVNGISADGNSLMLFGNYEGSFGHGDLFFVEKDSSGAWGDVQHFPAPINTEYYEADGTFTSDGKAILFSSDRPGCVGEFHERGESYHGDTWGNTDIFVSVKQSDGSWGDPINLGSTINTPYSERKPFLHPDGKTLYFSSDGHAGLGMMDIYKSTRLDDSWTNWSEPVNLGKEVNNGADNFGFKVETSGMYAYVSLDNRTDGLGQGDIYRMTMPAASKPAAIAEISGTVTDENGSPLQVSIKWDDLESGKNVGELSSDPKTGNYVITLPLDKNYGYFAEKDGYYSASSNVDLRGKTESVSHTENIKLISIAAMKEKDISVRLNNIFFDFDQATLKPESYPELGRLATILKKNPDAKAEIGGHTDNKGSHQYNLNLSKKRTQAVVDYLVAQGCNSSNLTAKGYAETEPVASNDTDDGRAQNRRVEFRFLK